MQYRYSFLIVVLSALVGCSGSPESLPASSYDVCSDLREMNTVAAAALGLTPPVDFVELRVSTCSEGTFADSTGGTAEVCFDGGGCAGPRGWSFGRCRHFSHRYSWDEPPELADPAQEETIRILLGTWLHRRYSLRQLAALSERRFENPQGIEPDYLAFQVFRQTLDPRNCLITEMVLCDPELPPE